MVKAADSILQKAVETGRMHAVAAAASKDGKIIYQGAFGTTEVGGVGVGMTLETPLRLFSMTKAITCTCVMQLVERGKLSLDQEVRTIIPEWDNIKILKGFDANDQPILETPTTRTTIRHLATHSSGLGYDIWNPNYKKYLAVTGKEGRYTKRAGFLSAVLSFNPGENWQYGINIDVLGWIVGLVSGKTLEEYMQENIFNPLGMSNTSFFISPETNKRRPQIAQRQADGSLIATFLPELIEPAEEQEVNPGGAGLFGTCADYLKYITALANGGGPILKPESTKVLLSNQLGDIIVNALPVSDPPLLSNAYAGTAGQRWSVIGMVNTEDFEGRRKAGSNSWAGLANTYFWVDPTTHVAGVLCTQMYPFADSQVLQTVDEFERAVYAEV